MKILLYTTLKLLALLPRPLLQWQGRLLGRLHLMLNTRAAKVTRINIDLCFPDMPAADRRRLMKESLLATGQTLFETPAVWLGRAGALHRWIAEVHGEAHLLEALEADEGLIVLLPHIGNWELFNYFFQRYADRFGQMTALYQPPKQAILGDLIEKVRQHHGNRMVSTDAAGLRRLYARLQAGGTVVVLPDQVPSRGELAAFFGEQAMTDTLIPRLADHTSARIITAAIIRRPDGRFAVHLDFPGALHEGEGEPGRGEPAPTSINRLVERAVALAPAQYQWEYKRFKSRGDNVYRNT